VYVYSTQTTNNLTSLIALVTGQLTDMPTHGLFSLHTGQVTDWKLAG